jgi:hypothetical protein
VILDKKGLKYEIRTEKTKRFKGVSKAGFSGALKAFKPPEVPALLTP